MAGNYAGDGLPANLAGMSKTQLYDIMSQMKTLIEQNQQQARQILIQNPLLTKALFQAQIMLGMVQPPKAIPNVQPPAPQLPQQSASTTQQPSIQAARSSPGQIGIQDQTGASQIHVSERKQQQNQQAIPISAAAVPPISVQSQPMHSGSLPPSQQSKGYQVPQVNSVSLPQPSQLPNVAPIPLHSSAQSPSLHQPQIPSGSSQLQPPLQSGGISHLPLQPPLLQQSRPPSVPSFHHHHYTPHMGPNMGYQPAGAPQHVSQPIFHPGNKPAGVGPSFPQGKLPLPNQQLPQSLYQAGGSHLGSEFSSQAGNVVQGDRGSSWMPGSQENSTIGLLSGPPSLTPSQIGPGNQAPRPPPLSPEMEQALLQQVMSLTPEQINLLPPEQRNQVLQLQQMLRH